MFTPPEERFLACLPPRVRWGYDKATPYWGAKDEIIQQAAYVTLPVNKYNYLFLDLDDQGAGAFWLDESLPQPTFITVTPENSHAFYGYELTTPVIRRLEDGACWVKSGPIEYFEAVRAAFQNRLCADVGYSEWNCKNPLSGRWKPHTHWYDRQYSLDELAKHVSLASKWERRKQKVKGRGITSPNARLFDAGRLWAYRHVRCHPDKAVFEGAVFDFLDSYNRNVIAVDYGKSEPASNVHNMALSVSKYTWKNRNEAWMADCAKERGKLGLGRICPNLTQDERREEVKARQEAGALFVNAERKAKTFDKIIHAVSEIRSQGERVTVAGVARKAKVSRPTVYGYKHLLVPNNAKV